MPSRLRRILVNSVKACFAEPDFDLDSGVVKVMKVNRGVVVTLFATDEDGNETGTVLEQYTIKVQLQYRSTDHALHLIVPVEKADQEATKAESN